MSTIQEHRWLPTEKHIQKADRAFLLSGVFDANVSRVVFESYSQTRIALFTVEKVFSATQSADSTVVAVKVTFGFIVVENIAFFTEILGKLSVTLCAVLSR